MISILCAQYYSSACHQTVIAEYFPAECNCIYGNCNASSTEQIFDSIVLSGTTLDNNRLSKWNFPSLYFTIKTRIWGEAGGGAIFPTKHLYMWVVNDVYVKRICG